MKKRSLEIDDDIEFQRKEWIAQRVGIGLLSLFVLGALLGLTGVGGPLSHGEAGDRNGAIHVEYERYVRRGAMSTITLHLRGNPTNDVQFWVSAPYFEHVRIETIVPEPVLLFVDKARHVYAIRSGSPEVTITLEIEHKTVGTVEGEVGLIGGPSLRFTQLSIF